MPRRHIRDINHLRPRLFDPNIDSVNDPNVIQKDNDIIVVNKGNETSDIDLIEHMMKVSEKFMRDKFPDNEEGYTMGFHRPPSNSKFHLHMHIVVLPWRRNITDNLGLYPAEDVLEDLRELL